MMLAFNSLVTSLLVGCVDAASSRVKEIRKRQDAASTACRAFRCRHRFNASGPNGPWNAGIT